MLLKIILSISSQEYYLYLQFKFKTLKKWLTLFLTTAPLAELALTSVRLKLSPKVISTKLMLTFAPIADPALMYVRLKQFHPHNFNRFKQN